MELKFKSKKMQNESVYGLKNKIHIAIGESESDLTMVSYFRNLMYFYNIMKSTDLHNSTYTKENFIYVSLKIFDREIIDAIKRIVFQNKNPFDKELFNKYIENFRKNKDRTLAVLAYLDDPVYFDDQMTDSIYDAMLTYIGQVLSENEVYMKEVKKEKNIKYHLNLNDDELKIILFLIYYYNFNLLDLYEFFICNSIEDLINIIAKSTNIKYDTVMYIILYSHSFEDKKLLQIRNYDQISVSNNIIYYLQSGDENLLRPGHIVAKNKFSIDSFSEYKDSIKIMQSLLTTEKPSSLIIYGPTGVGKTEFAKTVALSVTNTVYFFSENSSHMFDFNKSEVKSKSIVERMFSLQNLAFSLHEHDILIVDDADVFLNYSFAGLLSKFLNVNNDISVIMEDIIQRVKCHIIFVVQTVSNIPQSILRKISYNICMHSIIRKQRVDIWKYYINKYSLSNYFNNDKIIYLSDRYKINASGIINAIESFVSFIKLNENEEIKAYEVMEDVLEKYQRLNSKNYLQHMTNKNILVPQYDIDLVNIDMDYNKLIDAVIRFYRFKENESLVNSSLTILLEGAEGTGKTEFAKFISDKVIKPLKMLRTSDFLSPFIGNTEKLIAKTFKDLEEEEMILLDDCEVMIPDRSKCHTSWELSITNEFINAMEKSNTVVICTTKNIDLIDPAAMRRFHFKIHFDAPNNVQLINLYKKYFEVDELSKQKLNLVGSLNGITASDIKSVWQKTKFILENDFDEDLILNELVKEHEYKILSRKQVVGF